MSVERTEQIRRVGRVPVRGTQTGTQATGFLGCHVNFLGHITCDPHRERDQCCLCQHDFRDHRDPGDSDWVLYTESRVRRQE